MSDCKVEIKATINNAGIEIYYDGRFVAKTNYSEHSEKFIVWLNDAINKANGTNTSVYKALHKHFVSNNEANNICPSCHKPKRMQNNILQLLCECDSEVTVCCDTCKYVFPEQKCSHPQGCEADYELWEQKTDC